MGTAGECRELMPLSFPVGNHSVKRSTYALDGTLKCENKHRSLANRPRFSAHYERVEGAMQLHTIPGGQVGWLGKQAR
jgi:hypothetical protein